MMKNYKKIAMGTATLTKTSNNLYNLDMNINFNPKRVIVIFLKGYTNKEEYTKYMAGLDTKQGQFGTNVSKRTFFLYNSNGNGVQLQIHSWFPCKECYEEFKALYHLHVHSGLRSHQVSEDAVK